MDQHNGEPGERPGQDEPFDAFGVRSGGAGGGADRGALVPYEPPDAALHPAEDGAGLEFNRPPRLLPPGGTTRFQLPSPPARPERRPVPVLMALVPVVLGVGIVIAHPALKMPATTPFISGGGPVISGPVWPFVCIVIMCGAISGFHALIASGTTPKMISRTGK